MRLGISSEKPIVSVILSTYNRLRPEGCCKSLLGRAIESILAQTYPSFELILIDDASTDGSADYCKHIASNDPRVRFFPFQENSGIPAIRYNFGISVSVGK